MKYRGQIKNGVVVLEPGRTLDEGTEVLVEPVSRAVRRGTPEALRQLDVRWAGPVEELDRLLAEVQAMREAELTPTDDRA